MRIYKAPVTVALDNGNGPAAPITNNNVGNFVAGEVPNYNIIRSLFPRKILQFGKVPFSVPHKNTEAVFHRARRQ